MKKLFMITLMGLVSFSGMHGSFGSLGRSLDRAAGKLGVSRSLDQAAGILGVGPLNQRAQMELKRFAAKYEMKLKTLVKENRQLKQELRRLSN